ncbi:hypothetical protein [Methylobacterium sp. OT2]|uniref:hypothetical protein n=1 Tax=Methylobacterium sp. OT2 TaxID=2813779 RepID=UPI0032B145E6
MSHRSPLHPTPLDPRPDLGQGRRRSHGTPAAAEPRLPCSRCRSPAYAHSAALPVPRGGGCSSINASRELRLGRGDPRFTADRTAFVVIRGTAPTGARAIFCIETKNSGAGHDPALPPHPRHQEIGRTTTGLFIAPEGPALTGPACRQLGLASARI